MHPILARTDRLALYLGGWLIVSVLLGSVLALQGLTWVEALLFLVPITIVYGFVCLSAWYVCRGTPLVAHGGGRALASAAVAAVVASGLWAGLSHLWINVLVSFPMLAAAEEPYRRQVPLLFASGVLLSRRMADHPVLIFVDISPRRGGFSSLVFAADETSFHSSPCDLRITNYVLQSLACLTSKLNTTLPLITSTLL